MFDNVDVEDNNDDDVFQIVIDGYNFSLYLDLFPKKQIVNII